MPQDNLKLLLVVDDNTYHAMLTNTLEMREDLKFSVKACKSNAEALKNLSKQSNEVNIVITGDNDLEALRDKCGIILHTTRNYNKDQLKQIETNGVKYLPKPTSSDELVAAIKYVAEKNISPTTDITEQISEFPKDNISRTK